MTNKYHNRGETIVEVLVAVVISTMVLLSVFLLLNRAIDTNINVKNRVIGLNIAREGVEAMRNIRDTNWLKYAGDRRGKWLCFDAVGSDTCETTPNSLTDGRYTIDYDDTKDRYYLKQMSLGGLDLENASETVNDQYRLYVDATTGRFTHDAAAGANKKTRFYREIALTTYNVSGSAVDTVAGCTAANHCKEAKVKVLATVQWIENGVVRRSALEHYLYDFYERDSY